MSSCTVSDVHDTISPPTAVVRVNVLADPGDYRIRVILESTHSVFAGPKSITVPASGELDVDIPIVECSDNSTEELRTASVMVQIAEGDSGDFVDKCPYTVNYKCA